MEPKYFRYISKSKVDMLANQYQISKANITDVKPKISFLGFEFEVGFGSQLSNTDSLIPKTIQLFKELAKDELVKPLNNSSELSTTLFYEDTDFWHNGIIAWEAKDDDETPQLRPMFDAYFAMKVMGDSLILLIGSLPNIIGNTNADSRQIVYTMSTELIFEKILRNSIREVVEAEQSKKTISDDVFTKREGAGVIKLATFCLRKKYELPKMKLNTTFKIFHQTKVRKIIGKLAQLDSVIINSLLNSAKDAGVFEFSNFYIGSPIYTARA
jgi:hypothetical protein